MSWQVRLAGPTDLPAVYALRHEVFVQGQDVPAELERDDLDATADHVIVLEGTIPVGTGRLVNGRVDAKGQLEPGTVGTIGRMAVTAAARGRGVGAAVLARLEDLARERGLPAVELHAQLHAVGFYQRAGFAAFGEVYLEAGIEHVGMRKPF